MCVSSLLFCTKCSLLSSGGRNPVVVSHYFGAILVSPVSPTIESESVKFNHDVAMTRDVLKHIQQWKESGGWALPRSGITHVLVCRIYTFLFCLDQVCVMQILYLTKTYEIFKKAKSYSLLFNLFFVLERFCTLGRRIVRLIKFLWLHML